MEATDVRAIRLQSGSGAAAVVGVSCWAVKAFDYRRSLCLLVVTLCIAAVPAGARTWHQVPAHGAWVDIPFPWRVTAHTELPQLQAKDPKLGGRMLVRVVDGPEELALEAGRRVASHWFKGIKWSKKNANQGVGTLSGNKSLVAVATAAVGKKSLFFLTVGPKRQGKALSKLLTVAKASLRVAWGRPGGAVMTVGATGVSVSQPDDGWTVTTAQGPAVQLASTDGKAKVHVFGSKRRGATPASALEMLARGYEMLTFAPPTAWAPASAPKGQGLTLTGVGKPEGRDIHTHFFAWKTGDTIIVVMGMVDGGDATALGQQIAAIAGSLAVVAPMAP